MYVYRGVTETTAAHLHHGADGLSVSKNLTQSLGAEYVAQRCLCEQLCRPRRVLNVDDWDTRVGDAIVDDCIHGDCHRVTGQYLPRHAARTHTTAIVVVIIIIIF